MTDDTNRTVRLSGKLICRSFDEVALVSDNLAAHVRLTLAEPGCLSFQVWPSVDPLVWHVEECFADAAAFAHHQQRTRASSWWTATEAISRSYVITGMEQD